VACSRVARRLRKRHWPKVCLVSEHDERVAGEVVEVGVCVGQRRQSGALNEPAVSIHLQRLDGCLVIQQSFSLLFSLITGNAEAQHTGREAQPEGQLSPPNRAIIVSREDRVIKPTTTEGKDLTCAACTKPIQTCSHKSAAQVSGLPMKWLFLSQDKEATAKSSGNCYTLRSY
jgi:hypothetical protein